MDGNFSVDLFWGGVGLAALVVVASLAVLSRRRRPALYVGFSDLDGLATEQRGIRERLAYLPRLGYLGSLVLLALSLLDPTYFREVRDEPPPKPKAAEERESEEAVSLPTEGIALYFVLDRSGSMREPVGTVGLKSVGGSRVVSRLDALKLLTAEFIRGNPASGLSGRSSDMIGLVGFARTAEVLSPLTLDHRAVLEKLAELSVVRYRPEDGTSIGYALYKTTSLIAATRHFATALIKEGRPSYDIKSASIVLVTDGIQSPNALDEGHPLRQIGVEEAAKSAKEYGIKVYIVNIEPIVRAPQYKLQRDELQRAAEMTGGKFYIADDAGATRKIYAEIDALERSLLPQDRSFFAKVRERVTHEERPASREAVFLSSYFVVAALVLILISSLLEATWLRRVP